MGNAVRKFGFELEYASGATDMVRLLHDPDPSNLARLMATDRLHDYHCRCEYCSFVQWEDYSALDARGRPKKRPPLPLRAQRDSTANGEFITKPIETWEEFQTIVKGLTDAATAANATTNDRCGLHVHVDTTADGVGDADFDRYNNMRSGNDTARTSRRRITPAAYLAYERYFAEIVAPGSSIRKREMNMTLMQATRNFVSNQWGGSQNYRWMDMGRGAVDDLLMQVINADRHVDLNWSRGNQTWEFRAFNATNAPWRIELACRLATAFVEAAPDLRDRVERVVRGSKYWPEGCDSPWGEIIRPAFSELPAPHPTKKPIVPMSDFIDSVCSVDPDLRPLIERQANYMRARFATKIEVAA